jgi:hypothetical protein
VTDPQPAQGWSSVGFKIDGMIAGEAFTTIKLFIRKSFLWENDYDTIAVVIAHELSHVVLNSIHHPLRTEEKAVDLTAMLLGFSKLYLTGSDKTHSPYTTKRIKVGYLSRDELRAASRILVPARNRIAYVVLIYGPACVFMAWLGFILLNGFWSSFRH